MAKWLYLFSANALLFVLSCSWGAGSGLQWGFLGLFVLVFYLYNKRPVMNRLLSSGIIGLTFFLLEFNNYDLLPALSLSSVSLALSQSLHWLLWVLAAWVALLPLFLRQQPPVHSLAMVNRPTHNRS